MKKAVSLILTLLILLGAVGCANQTETPASTEPTWSSFLETANGYVYELYNFDVPTVTDVNGKELKVKVKATDKDGKELDTTGGFFAIRTADEYTITYTVESEGKTYSKTAKVTGVFKTEYSLSPLAIYGTGEEIDLSKQVISSLGGEISYQVQKDGERQTVTDKKFTPSEVGTYKVIASIEKQPDFEYNLTVVDKSVYPNPNGLITDKETAEAFSVSIDKYSYPEGGEKYRNEADLTESATTSVTQSEENFYNDGGKSTKISITFPETSKAFESSITFKPEFSYEYYKSLELSGYEYVAVRMKVKHSNPNTEKEYNIWSLRPFKLDTAKMDIKLIDKNGDEVLTKNSYVMWNNDVELLNGEWFELLLPLNQFLSRYNETGITLFKYVTNGAFDVKNGNKQVKFDNMYGTLDIYIDNVYAASSLEGESVSEASTISKGEKFDFDTLKADCVLTDVDKMVDTATLNGKTTLVENGKLELTEYGVYTVERRARNRFGTTRAKVSTLRKEDVSQVIAEFTSTDGIYTSKYWDSESTELKDVTIAYDNDNSAVRLTAENAVGRHYFDVYLDTQYSKEYFEFVKKETDYTYVTFRVGLASGKNYAPDVRENTHYGNVTAENSGVYIHDGTELKATNRISYWNSGIGWLEVSIKLEDFINNYSGMTSKLLRIIYVSSNSAPNNLDVYISGIYLTTDGVVPKA